MKKNAQLILKVFVSSALLGLIFYRVDIEALKQNVSAMNPNYIFFIVLLLILNYVVSSFRWKSLLIFKSAKKISVKYLIYLYFTGSFFNNFMPTSIGGDVYKVFKLGKKMNNTVDAFSATFMERFTGVIALVLISVVSLINLFGLWGVILLLGFLLGLVVGFYALSFLSAKSEKIKKIYDSLVTYRGENKVLFWAFLTSFVVQILAIATQYVIFLALGIELPIFYALFVLPVITLAGFFIPSLNGVGVQDALYMQLFLSVGVAEPLSLSASLLYHMFRLAVSLIGGVLYAMGKDS